MSRSEFEKVVVETMNFVRCNPNARGFTNREIMGFVEKQLGESLTIEGESHLQKRVQSKAKSMGLHKHTNYNR